ncbi:glycosyltransferase family 4 protein [Devosia sp.]|uniref:glycosyltransferase family 4 protein n=1 Tax=Devosia sp. TaxID=1871048 RepID=UPI0025FA882A|nr:glycosyltransferase family 4 protein [Devosia sp.]MCR6633570.1 glycosyltransferase family 4 protein [Devosia sp.]
MERPLRILQVMRAPVGGLFRHVADLTRGLKARGHSVGLIVDSLASDAQTERRLDALRDFADLGVHAMPMPRVLGRGDLSTPFAVRKLARDLAVDILHGHGAKGGFYARLAHIGRKRPVALYTPHGGVLHFSARSKSGQAFHWLERRLLGETGAIIFESNFARETYGRLITPPTCRTEIIYNGLDAGEFEPVAIAEDAADFVFVGELRELKGIFPLVEAMVGLRRQDGTPATLVMAGDGPQRVELEERITALSLTERVRLVGSQPARAVFAQGRVAVLPSLAESLPYVVLEATAAQLPVVTTSVGGIPEIFAGTAETLVPPGDAEALAAAMQAVLDRPEAARAEMQVRLSRVASEFSLETMVRRIEALYRDVQEKG